MNTHIHPARIPHIVLVALFTVLSLFALTFSGCKNNPIFASIEEEVKLEEPTMRGNIRSVVAAGGNVYATNGTIYRRSGGTGSWNDINIPSYLCAELATDAADGTGNLYGLFMNSDYEYTSVKKLTGSTWVTVTGASDIKKIGSGDGFIYGFSDNGSDWDAFKTGSPGGTTFTAIAGASGIALPVQTAGDWFATEDKIYTSGGTVFADASAPSTTIKGLATDGTRLYAVTAGTVFSCTPATPATDAWTTLSHDVADPVCLAWLGGGTTGKNLILIAGSTGYDEVTLDGSGAMTGTQQPGDSSSSSVHPQEQTQYENSMKLWNLSTIVPVTNPVSSANTYVIYAGVIDTRYDGLWAYYSDSPREWNRE